MATLVAQLVQDLRSTACANVSIVMLARALAMWLLSSLIRLRTVSVLDGAAFAAGILVVVAATALGAYQPARRATRVDPALALRTDG